MESNLKSITYSSCNIMENVILPCVWLGTRKFHGFAVLARLHCHWTWAQSGQWRVVWSKELRIAYLQVEVRKELVEFGFASYGFLCVITVIWAIESLVPLLTVKFSWRNQNKDMIAYYVLLPAQRCMFFPGKTWVFRQFFSESLSDVWGSHHVLPQKIHLWTRGSRQQHLNRGC